MQSNNLKKVPSIHGFFLPMGKAEEKVDNQKKERTINHVNHIEGGGKGYRVTYT